MNDMYFIYDSKESRFSKLECYYIYDSVNQEILEDNKLNKCSICLDRENKLIYFMGMEVGEHYILEEQFYIKIIKKFMDERKCYNCEDYDVFMGTTGGMMYYKHLDKK